MSANQVNETARDLLGRLATLIGVEVPSPQPPTTPVTAGLIDTATSSSSRRTFPESPTTSELARLFAPYPRHPNSTFRLAGRPARRSNPISNRLPLQIRDWSGRFCCLGGPEDQSTPIDRRMLVLKEKGLGDGVIIIHCTASTEELKAALEATFPSLSIADYELLRSLTGGKGKPMVRVDSIRDVPAVPYLKSLRRLIYIRPKTSIVDHQDAEERSAEIDLLQQPAIVTELPTQLTVADICETVMTVEDFRNQQHSENPGYQFISVSRGNMLQKILGVYKDTAFNIFKKPKVEFNGEPGADVGALTREYFWEGLLALQQERIDGMPLFEGERDHFIPSTDSRLLRTGVFKVVGKFMAHATIHCGIGFLGLSTAVVDYLTCEVVDSDTPLSLVIDDVPDMSIRTSLDLVDQLKSGATLTDEERTNLQSTAHGFDFNEDISCKNASFAFEHILYQSVIKRRIRQLDSLKSAFQVTGLTEFLKDKPYLTQAVFPRMSSIDYPPHFVIQKLKCEGAHTNLSVIKTFIENLCNVPQGIQKLLCAWTGWAIIPEGDLLLRFEDETEFEVHTCANEIVIPTNLTATEIVEKFNLLINFGVSGFGGI